MKITVLGPGCVNCETVADRARAAVEDLGVAATLEKVDDYAEIARRGVVSTPALSVDGTVVVSGRVPSIEEISGWLRRAAGDGEG